MGQAAISPYEQALDRLEQTGHYICFEYLGASVGFYSDDQEATSYLNKRFAGYFSATENRQPDVVVYSTADRSLFDQLYGSISSRLSSGETFAEQPLDDARTLVFDSDLSKKVQDEICFVLDHSRRSTFISYSGLEARRRALEQRVVRNIVILQLLAKGWVLVHASAVERHGSGICVIGGKHSGKTSTLMNLLSGAGTKLVSNDKVFVRDGGSSIEGCGFPNQLGIRIGTLLANPELQRLLDTGRDSFYSQINAEELQELAATTPADELHSRTEKITLLPLDMVDHFGISLAPTTTVKAFVSVRFEPDLDEARMTPLEGEEAIATVMEHFRRVANERQGFLQRFFALSDDEMHERLVGLLTKYASAISVQELTQSARTNAQTQELVDELAREMSRNAATV